MAFNTPPHMFTDSKRTSGSVQKRLLSLHHNIAVYIKKERAKIYLFIYTFLNLYSGINIREYQK